MAETNEATLATLACAFKMFPGLFLWVFCDLKKRSMLHLQSIWGPTWTSFSTSSSSVRWKELAWKNIRKKWDPKSLKKPWPTFFVCQLMPSQTTAGAPTLVRFPFKNRSHWAHCCSHNGDIMWIRKSKNQQLSILAKKNSCVLFQQMCHLSYFFY